MQGLQSVMLSAFFTSRYMHQLSEMVSAMQVTKKVSRCMTDGAGQMCREYARGGAQTKPLFQ